MTDYKVTGPKGNPVVNRAKLARVKTILPALVKRFGRVTVAEAPAVPVDLRAGVVAWALRGVKDEPKISYAQVRPMPLQWALPMRTDCSGFATLCFKMAGAPDPNGLNYSGQGYTGTLLKHGKLIPQGEARPGDLVFFGPKTAEHVCVLVDRADNPLLVSHGQERGPLTIRLSAEAAFHSKPVRFRSYL